MIGPSSIPLASVTMDGGGVVDLCLPGQQPGDADVLHDFRHSKGSIRQAHGKMPRKVAPDQVVSVSATASHARG